MVEVPLIINLTFYHDAKIFGEIALMEIYAIFYQESINNHS